MEINIDWIDSVIFIVSLGTVVLIGLWAGRKEENAEDFYLAGKSIPWWGIAGSIFGSNVSAQHMAGAMGAGFLIGLAQVNYDLMSIIGAIALCYLFSPVYRAMNIYTLSQYLENRFDEKCRLAYSLIITLGLTMIWLFMGIYFGGRSLSVLLQGTPFELSYPTMIIVIAVVAGGYTIFGGLKAVIYTDVIQSVLLIGASLLIAVLVFKQPEIDGIAGLFKLEEALPAAKQKLHIVLQSDHPNLPWFGVITGLMILNVGYFGTNQFITQRVLAAKSDKDAKIGAIIACYLKLLLVLAAVLPGVAAVHLFRAKQMTVVPDDVFAKLVKMLVPAGYGIVGLILTGLVGAILSSVDSLLNSGATLLVFDFYKKYFRKNASDRELIQVGRVIILVLLVIASLLAIAVYDPNAKSAAFLRVTSWAGHLLPGLVMCFIVAILWIGATSWGAFVALVSTPVISCIIPFIYNKFFADSSMCINFFGSNLNFLYRTAIASIYATLIMIVVSLMTKNTRDSEKEKFVIWHYKHIVFDKASFLKVDLPWLGGLIVLGIFLTWYFA
jgi:SSS family solute:Na+ symporter